MSSPTLVIKTQVDLGAASQMDALKSNVVSNTNEMANGFQRMGETAKRSSFEAQGAVRLLGEEVGVHMSRHISRFISQLPGVGTAMAAAFNVFAIVGVIEVLGQVINKITEVWNAAEKNAEAWRKIEQTARDANEKIEKEIDAQEKKYIELTQGPVAGLIFEIGHMRSVAVEAFKEIEKQMDEVQKQFAEEGGGMQWMIGMGSQARALAEDVKKTSLEIQEAQRKAQIGLPALKTPEQGKTLSAEDQAFNTEVLTRPIIAAEDVIRNKINEINKIPLVDVSDDQRDKLQKLQQTYIGIYAQLEKQRTLQADMVRDKATEEKVEVHKIGVGEGDERIAAQKRQSDAEIKLTEETAVLKAKAVSSADKLAALESGLAKTKDLDAQAIYSGQIYTLTVKTAEQTRDAEITAANARYETAQKADHEIIALHNSSSEEDKKARQKAEDDLKLLEITNKSELLKINEDYNTKLLAAQQRAAQDEDRINDQQRLRTITQQELVLKGQEVALSGQEKAIAASYAQQAKNIEESFKLRTVSGQTEHKELLALYSQEESDTIALLEKKKALLVQEEQLDAKKNGEILTDDQTKLLPGVLEIDNQILQATQNRVAKEEALERKLQDERKKIATDTANSFKSMYDTMVLQSTSFHDATTKLWQSMGKKFTDNAFKMVGDWMTAQEEGSDFSAITALKQITHSAYQAAANTYAAVSETPIIGPVLAPVAAAGAFVAVMAFGSGVGSAQQGAILPNDMMILAHQNEMILPAPISKAVQNMTQSGGQSGSAASGDTHVHLHVTAMDSTDFDRVLQNNLSSIGRAVISSKKAGHIPASAIAH